MIIDFVDGKWDCDRNVDLEYTFDPGCYLISAEVEWNKFKIDRRFSISTYSRKQVELT